MKIHSRFINDAVRIRKEYLSCMYQILINEEKVNEEKQNIQNIMSELNNIYADMESKKSYDSTILNGKLLDIDVHIKKIQSEFIPINEKMESLKLQAKKLNTVIKEKYPSLSDLDINIQLQPHLEKCDKNFKNCI